MEAFGTVLIVICVLAVVVAGLSYRGTGRIYSGLGREGGMSMDSDQPGRARGPAAPAADPSSPEAQEEIRQLLEAKNARREARGQAPLDVDAELASLTEQRQGGADPALRDEVRQLVIARNERRERQGKPPLDVEQEVERQLRELGG
jgi:hypothetical protein